MLIQHKRPSFPIFFLACLLLAGCSSFNSDATPASSPQVTVLETTRTVLPSATPTEAPSQTPEPPRMLLVAPSDPSLPQRLELEETLAELSAAAGIAFEVSPVLTPADLTPGLKVVVVLPPDPGLEGLVAEAPDTQFLAIGIPGLEAGGNLSVISSGGFSADQMGFLAGYLAAVVTPEWRVGMAGVSDTEPGIQTRQSFLNGVVFFCGLCQQTYTPFYTYPMYVELPAASSPSEWQAAADVLVDKAVRTAFIAPGAGDDALLNYLAEAGVQIIGTAPPPPGAQDKWIASINPDIIAPLETLWPDLLSGKGGQSLPASLTIGDINAELFSPGRQRLVKELLSKMEAGYIDTSLAQSLPTP